jgi:DNA-directed RNA polymerase subunit M/transcription elongation factor TFIIS
MFELSLECTRCGALLKKQVIGSNKFYYCKKCGCISSSTAVNVPVQSANEQINIESKFAVPRQ